MPRAIWKGNVGFGLVNIPVGLYAAEKRDEISFDLLEKKSKSRIFVELSEIGPVYFDKPYYLGPQKKGQKPYALLREVLERTGKVGIAKVVIRTRQYLSAVVPRDEVLVLELLRFQHELRSTDELDLPGTNLEALGITEREIEMGEKLVEGMAGSWDPERYKDDYRSDLLKLIEKRAESGELEGIEEPAPRPAAETGAKVIDLMALLKQSVEESGKGRGARAARGKGAAKRRMPAQKASPRRTSSRRAPAKKSA